MKEITLQGTFSEMGQQYGSQFKGIIKKMIFEFKLLAVAAEGEGRDFFRPKIRHMLGALFIKGKYNKKYEDIAIEFEANIARYYPQILEMIKGMAQGAKVDYRDLIFTNCLIEYSLKCSAFGAAGSATKKGTPLIGMNADEMKSAEKYYNIIHLYPSHGFSYTAIVITGTIFPAFGMNEHGLSFASLLLFLDNNKLSSIRHPSFLKFSAIHSCKTVEEAKKIFDAIPPSGIGTATYVADSKQLFVQEENVLCKKQFTYINGTHHTANFPQSKELQQYVKLDKLDDIIFFFAKNRHKRIGNSLLKHNGSLDEDIFYSILSDHGSTTDGSLNKSVCVHPKNTKGIKTCASVILSPDEKVMRVYNGNPCENRLRIIPMNNHKSQQQS